MNDNINLKESLSSKSITENIIEQTEKKNKKAKKDSILEFF